MDYKEVKDKVNSIIESIERGNYEVSYEEPNNIERCTAPDGRTFYKIIDMDGPKTSTDFGSCEVMVNGYYFRCDWIDWPLDEKIESDFLDQIEDCYELSDGSRVYKEDILEELVDEFEKREDIYFGTYVEMDDQMWIYSKINDMDIPDEYYWWEDSDCPVNIDGDWYPPQELGYGIVEYNGEKYYLVDDLDETDLSAVHAVRSNATPNDKAQYKTVIMQLEYEGEKLSVININDSDDLYDAAEGSISF